MRYLALTAALCSAAALAQEPADLTYRSRVGPAPTAESGMTTVPATAEPAGIRQQPTSAMGAPRAEPGERRFLRNPFAGGRAENPYPRPLQPGSEWNSPQ